MTLPRRISAVLFSIVALSLLQLVFLAPASAAPTDVVINEVESNGGTPGDWVELYNSGAEPVDVSGWTVMDNDDTHVYTIPAGTTIAAGAYLVIDEESAAGPGLSFGLGANDMVRISDSAGTLIDSYAWTSHAMVTYGRCPNGAGDFRPNDSATKGAANDCTPPLRINEVESSGGVPGDWVEIINTGAVAYDAGGLVVKDNDDTHAYVIPAGTTIDAGGFLVIEESALGFGLGGSDSARLMDDAGAVIDSYTWTAHATTTYGRCPDGTGDFAVTATATKGAVNDCVPVAGQDSIKINEVESSGGVPGDWVELVNTSTAPVDISGWLVRDNDDTRFATIPAGTTIAAGGFYIVEESVLGFGLGANDMARLYLPDGTLVDSTAWSAHAATSWARCPDASGSFTVSTAVTKATANSCGSPVVINEVESSGGTPGDWLELGNPTAEAIDLSGFSVRDNDDTHIYTLPAGTTIAANGYLIVEEADLGFGLGGGDSARLFDAAGTLVDSYTWTTHAATTYGRCPDLTGEFALTDQPTTGAANVCPGEIVPGPWPGGSDVTTIDAPAQFDGDLSGLDYQGDGTSTRAVLWGVNNGTGTLYRLIWDGSSWVDDAGWTGGKTMTFLDGTGIPDSEGVSVGGDGTIFIGVERNNDAGSISRNTVLQIDPSAAGATLTPIQEWNLTADLPATTANGGIEAVEWIPDSALSALIDETTGLPYDPANYPLHGGGLVFVGVESTGMVYAYALNSDGTYARVATIDPGLSGVMALDYDTVTGQLWVVCDDTCNGTLALVNISTDGAVSHVMRPDGMPNINNEGFATSPIELCVGITRPVWWSDDNDTDGYSLREGTLPCVEPTVPVEPSDPATPTPTDPAPTTAPAGATTQPPASKPGPPAKAAPKLAKTGSPVDVLAVLGLGAIGLGSLLLRQARTRV